MSFASNSSNEEVEECMISLTESHSGRSLESEQQDDAWKSHLKRDPVWERFSGIVWNTLRAAPAEPALQYGAPASPDTVLQIVHPTGHSFWAPYLVNHTTVDMLKTEVAQICGWSPRDFQFSTSSRMLASTSSNGEKLLVNLVCTPGMTLFIVPRLPAMHFHPYPASIVKNWNFNSMAPGVVMTFDAVASNASTCPSCKAPLPKGLASASAQNAPTQAQSVTVLYNGLPINEKMQYAAANLMVLVNNTKQCTGLQSDIELALSKSIDCSGVFGAIETSVPDLLLHPAGNYLLSKCFDWHPALLNLAANALATNVKKYVLHKHGSYVAEAILRKKSPRASAALIASLLPAQACTLVAAHDSGNFVLQKAIENCPDDLLPAMAEAVGTVLGNTPHAAKMVKKLNARAAQSPGIVEVRKGSALHLPRSGGGGGRPAKKEHAAAAAAAGESAPSSASGSSHGKPGRRGAAGGGAAAAAAAQQAQQQQQQQQQQRQRQQQAQLQQEQQQQQQQQMEIQQQQQQRQQQQMEIQQQQHQQQQMRIQQQQQMEIQQQQMQQQMQQQPQHPQQQQQQHQQHFQPLVQPQQVHQFHHQQQQQLQQPQMHELQHHHYHQQQQQHLHQPQQPQQPMALQPLQFHQHQLHQPLQQPHLLPPASPAITLPNTPLNVFHQPGNTSPVSSV
ncbi:hypothetical protein DIPPA_05874 [Diplonema papillatum]|nr:hypothetical protein DIPPA_05874 [Diplonema papillatum]